MTVWRLAGSVTQDGMGVFQCGIKALRQRAWWASKFGDGDEAWQASAVFTLTSYVNHCCSPNAFVEPRWVDFEPGAFHRADGGVALKALTHIARGAEISINYGPRELLGLTGC